MKAYALMDQLIALSEHREEETVDTCKAGDPERELKKVAVCCIATPDVIRQAAAWGADLLITHEPTYYDHFDHFDEADPIAAKKRALLERTGMTLYRYHDHAHSARPDRIAAGELFYLGWKGRFDGEKIFLLDKPSTAHALARQIEERLGIAHVRMVGAADSPVRRIAVCFGAWQMLDIMKELDADCYLSGETSEWQVCERIRDAAQLGENKSMLVLGHMGSEKDGMRYLADYLTKTYDGFESRYFDCGEVYAYPDKA